MIKVLLAEDNHDLAFIMTTAMTMKGYRVHHVANADLVIPALYNFNPHLVILDIMMPSKQGLDGIELAQLIRQNAGFKHVPILISSAISTASGFTEDQMRAKIGADDYLAKPFEVDEFLLRVDRLLQAAGIRLDPEAGTADNVNPTG